MTDVLNSLLFSLAVLILAVGIGIPLILSSRWNVELTRRSREARARNDADFVRRVTRVRIGDVVIDALQLGLLLFVILARAGVIGWIVIGILFVISVAARLSLNRVKLRLLADSPRVPSQGASY